ncbi:uncharacterized protein LOC130303246 [Hyla sarda]|uniref:uncharacterized protein LOC130303246 n=1 Tax=Hyla sarda TaxID=327740 RepID=UPI0024C32060|nr:uncharacterized protein LOC130303246 [Hyla sarda]
MNRAGTRAHGGERHLQGPGLEDSSTAILFVFIVDYSTEQLYRRLINSSFLLLYCLLLIRAAFQKMPGCIVNGCKSRSIKGDHNIIMHSFPRERDRIMAWLLATDQEFPKIDELVDHIHLSKTNNYRLCSAHFKTTDYTFNPNTGKQRLTPFAVPSIFPTRDIQVQAAEAVEAEILNPQKRKRLDEDVASTNGLKPGEMCPTCRNIVPHVNPTETEPQASEITKKEAATIFDRNWGTVNQCIQVKPTTFSIKIQCRRLVKKKILRKKKSRQSLVFGNLPSEPLQGASVIFSTPKKYIGPTGSATLNSVPEFQESCRARHELLPATLLSELTISPIQPIEDPEVTVIVEESTLHAPISVLEVDKSLSTITTPVSTNESSSSDDEGDSVHSDDEDYEEEDSQHVLSEKFVNVNVPHHEERKFIVYESCLDTLLYKMPCTSNPPCNKKILGVYKKTKGSYISVFAEFEAKHLKRIWQSQPRLGKKPFGNLQLATAIITSGNTYIKIQQFLKIFNILGISQATYYRIQKIYIFPAIENS